MPEPRFDTYIWTNIAFKDETGEGSIQNVGPGGLFVRSSTIGATGDEVRDSPRSMDHRDDRMSRIGSQIVTTTWELRNHRLVAEPEIPFLA